MHDRPLSSFRHIILVTRSTRPSWRPVRAPESQPSEPLAPDALAVTPTRPASARFHSPNKDHRHVVVWVGAFGFSGCVFGVLQDVDDEIDAHVHKYEVATHEPVLQFRRQRRQPPKEEWP